MATVRESITALYEQSQKSAAEGQAMFAVIESEAVSSDGVEFDISGDDGRPSIARRFDDLRDLAEREARGDGSSLDTPPQTDEMVEAPAEFTAGSFGTTFDSSVNTVDIVPDISAQPPADNTGTAAATPDLPSEPPAPATGDALPDLGVADIQELVRQAWEDETALGRVAGPHDGTVPEKDGDSDISADDDPDIEAAMEDIAAAVIQSGDAAVPVDLTRMKADIVAAMRDELQAVVAADLRPMIKAAIAEALQELPATPPAPRARKAATRKTAARKTAATKKTAAKNTGETARKKTAADTDSDTTNSDINISDTGDSEG